MTGRLLPVLLALVTLSLPVRSTLANDSTGFQGTTGIELATTDEIKMVSEDLRIGLDEIAVDYVFHNVADHPVETMVVFPLPDLDLSQGVTAPAWMFPASDRDFLGFRLSIDGKPAQVSLERRAFYLGRDVTDEVEQAGAMDLVPWKAGGYDEQVKTLSAASLARLRQDGLLRAGEDDDTPQWVLRTRYFWHQKFPAGSDVRIGHRYKPFVGRALLGDLGAIDGRSIVGRFVGAAENANGDRYCLDAGTRRTLAAIQQRGPKTSMPFSAAEIEYILTTARNWRGPIGRFHLTLDKGAPTNILSLCWNGLKKTGATTFEATIENFVPDHDIRLLIFVRAQDTP